MLQRFAGFLLVAVALSTCSQDSRPVSPTSPTPQPPQASVRVSGRVIDYATGMAVAGQTIRWWSGSNSHLIVRNISSTTDGSGRFDIDLPVTDDFTPLADTLRFDIPQTSGSIRIPAKSLETNIMVNPGACNVRYGYVYDAVTHQPIAGARVSRWKTATTDASGFYQLEIVCNAPQDQSFGIGTTTISASHPSYQGTWEIDGRSEWTGRPGINRVDFALWPLGQ